MYDFSIGSFFAGLVILAIGVAFVRWHQWVADNFGGGIGSYERYKLWAAITCLLGIVVMVNLHATIILWLIGWFFP